MKIAVIGTGYVGLVTAAGLAEFGHAVIGTDKDAEKIEKIAAGIAPIYEPGLEDLLARNLKKGNLAFTPEVDRTIREADVIFVCVGTPQDENGRADMSQIESVSRAIAQNLNGYKVIVEKSTVPVKTSDWIKRIVTLYRKGDTPFDVASNPEFLREGAAVGDFLEPDRIIIGVESDRARDILVRIYDQFKDRILVTNIDTAELIKHASNSFLALKISYINMISDLCEKTDADVERVALGMGLDPRIGKQFLYAGIGYGGSCFPKDVKALIYTLKDYGFQPKILSAVEEVNKLQRDLFIRKIVGHLGEDLSGVVFAVWGLAFKPQTDDMREAPAIDIIRGLRDRGASFKAYDPIAVDNARRVIGDTGIEYVKNNYDALKGVDALLLLTEWHHFREPDFEKMKDLMKKPVIFDGRNQYDPKKMKEAGFTYFSIGR